MKVKIMAPNKEGMGTRVTVDGVDISNKLVGLQVGVHVGQVNTVVLHLVPTKLEIEGEFEIDTGGRSL